MIYILIGLYIFQKEGALYPPALDCMSMPMAPLASRGRQRVTLSRI